MSIQLQKRHTNFLLFAGAILLAILSRNVGIFWDNTLSVSKTGTFLLNNGIFHWILPDSIDAGHQPFIGSYMALVWKIFGKGLVASHLAMIPFIFGFFVQLKKFVSFYIEKPFIQWIAFLFIICDPTICAQLVFVDPEIIQTFFFFGAVNAILYRNIYLKALFLGLLGIVTYRGTMLCAGIFLFDFTRALWLKKESILEFIRKNFLPYLLGALPAIAFIVFRLVTKGWLKTHPDSPWAEDWMIVDLPTLLRNCVVLAHRYLDFGRIFIFGGLLAFLIWKRNFFSDRKVKELILLGCTSVIFIVITSLMYANPMGHRYFMVSYGVFILLLVYLIASINARKWIYIPFFIALFSGNLWIYPEKIAQGWDASLAGLPYFSLREKAIQYMDNHNIPIHETATFFSNYEKLDYTDLSGDQRAFKKFTETKNPQYVFYSTVHNISDKNLHTLKKEYALIKTFSSFRIEINILKKNTNATDGNQ